MSDYGANDPEIAELQQQYYELLHALQTGVKFEHEWGLSDAQSPKHLRVGVNSSITQSSALALLLMDKEIITPLEYWEAQVGAFEREVAAYEQRLSEHAGRQVKLA